MLPDRPFHNFTALEPEEKLILFSSETEVPKFG